MMITCTVKADKESDKPVFIEVTWDTPDGITHNTTIDIGEGLSFQTAVAPNSSFTVKRVSL